MALGPPLLSLQTLETLLTSSNGSIEQAPQLEANRRLEMATMVYSRWTEGGKGEAVLAEHYLDGTIDALDLLLCATSQSPDAVPDHQRLLPPECGEDGPHSSTSPSKPVQRAAAAQVLDGDTLMGYRHECPMPAGVPRRHASQLAYDNFVLQHMAPNQPVMIQGVTEGWAASRDWVNKEGGINLSFLAEHFGSARIWATECTSAADGYGGGRRHEMSLHEYAAWWKQHKAGLDHRLLYLKDWHFVNEFPEYQAYSTPPFFRDDCLNQYYDMRSGSEQPETGQAEDGGRSHDSIGNSDYRFVYLGPAGTKTAVHADVLNSFSWSVNLAGCKRWRLLPPQHTHLLYDRFGHELAPGFDADVARPGHFPNLALARQHVIEITQVWSLHMQGSGEAIFVPSGWHHTVENLQDTLSINHNWLNGFNLHWAWELLQKEHAAACAAIEDCRAICSDQEFEALVQRNMAANCGMDFRAAGEFVASIALGELQTLEASGMPHACQGEADSQCGACRGAEGQDSRKLPHPDKGSQRVENILLHSSHCQTRQPLAGDKLNRDMRTIGAAKLTLRQALPMLEGLLARVCCGDGCCSRPSSQVSDQDDATLATCERTEKHPSDVPDPASGGLKGMQEAPPLSGHTGQWRCMNDSSFWQTLERLALDIKAHVTDDRIPRPG